MPVFDFTNAPEDKKQAECTYETFRSSEKAPTAERPILLLENKKRAWKHHSCGVFTNPSKRTSFEFQEEDGTYSADILKIDVRFVGSDYIGRDFTAKHTCEELGIPIVYTSREHGLSSTELRKRIEDEKV